MPTISLILSSISTDAGTGGGRLDLGVAGGAGSAAGSEEADGVTVPRSTFSISLMSSPAISSEDVADSAGAQPSQWPVVRWANSPHSAAPQTTFAAPARVMRADVCHLQGFAEPKVCLRRLGSSKREKCCKQYDEHCNASHMRSPKKGHSCPVRIRYQTGLF
jgi:hypothetical protein